MEVSGLGKIFTDQLLDDESLYHCLGYDKEKHEGICYCFIIYDSETLLRKKDLVGNLG